MGFRRREGTLTQKAKNKKMAVLGLFKEFPTGHSFAWLEIRIRLLSYDRLQLKQHDSNAVHGDGPRG